MKRVTIKEIKRFLKTLEENRYRKLVHADARRIAWFVNNSLSEDYDTMPESMRKKWVKAEYKKERYMAKKFLESLKQNEGVETQIRQLVRETIQDLMEASIEMVINLDDFDKVKKLLKPKPKQLVKHPFAKKTFGLKVNKNDYNKTLELLVKNKINPGDPLDEDLYALPENKVKKIPTVCGSLREAMECLDRDRDFLKQGSVFTDDQIDAYIALKFDEIHKLEHTPHPIEFEMYYSC